MNILPTRLSEVLLIEPRLFRDSRGYFFETWNQSRLAEAGISTSFVQDNISYSTSGVLRGLHLQWPAAQVKLITVLTGAIFDVAVDVRRGSPTFGQWVGINLSTANSRQLFIPEGFAHGFVVVDGPATVSYKVSAPYTPTDEVTVAWNDPDLAIDWPLSTPLVSAKDHEGKRLRDIPLEDLPIYQPTDCP
ncbi:MAG: dTDP-4-dehydrorhamnose 3,5-epimerase [Isosphaeraceae bacterium]